MSPFLINYVNCSVVKSEIAAVLTVSMAISMAKLSSELGHFKKCFSACVWPDRYKYINKHLMTDVISTVS